MLNDAVSDIELDHVAHEDGGDWDVKDRFVGDRRHNGRNWYLMKQIAGATRFLVAMLRKGDMGSVPCVNVPAEEIFRPTRT